MNNMYELPEYPCKRDVWDILKSEKRPIVIYGMGNGADKLLRRFEKYGIRVSDIFASDGFVRGHSYAGFRVKSFSEIKENYSDFVIVLSFASNKPDVIELIRKTDAEHELYIPDMPVTDESEYFDRSFYNEHYSEIAAAYGLLCDEQSKKIFASVIKYKLSGKLSYLLDACSDKDEMYSLISRKNIKAMIDAGAYNGDTAREAIKYFKELNKIYAIEADKRNFKKLQKFAEMSDIDITAVNAAVWCERAKVDLIRQNEGSDPAAVVYDACHAAKNKNADVLIIDTAGRLHNKTNLMNELAKINRVIDRELPDVARENLLVLDATTGQNAILQAKEFPHRKK